MIGVLFTRQIQKSKWFRKASLVLAATMLVSASPAGVYSGVDNITALARKGWQMAHPPRPQQFKKVTPYLGEHPGREPERRGLWSDEQLATVHNLQRAYKARMEASNMLFASTGLPISAQRGWGAYNPPSPSAGPALPWEKGAKTPTAHIEVMPPSYQGTPYFPPARPNYNTA
ncbi:MAG: hypothetical protein JSS72_11735, partial [Armatimonadetes bacterium]|nr:hypothetical protein [Armatimonadota bacterium]